MSWTIQDFGAAGELVGAVASVVLLVYIAIQIRQNSRTLEHNTRATEAATRQAFTSQDQAYLSSSLDSTVLAIAVDKLERGEELSPLERSQLIARQHVNFRVFESAFSQFTRGVLEEGEWDRYRKIIAFLMRDDEPTRAMWVGLRDFFVPDFVAEVEQLAGGPLAGTGEGEQIIRSGTGASLRAEPG